jgi:hypothetical protein
MKGMLSPICVDVSALVLFSPVSVPSRLRHDLDHHEKGADSSLRQKVISADSRWRGL